VRQCRMLLALSSPDVLVLWPQSAHVVSVEKMSTQGGGVVALAPGAGLPIAGAGTGPGSELVVKALEADTRGAYSLLGWRSERGDAWVPPHIRQRKRHGTCWRES
jgi:hypothetical protein